ncbi:DedA family protein [Helicobacter didelphidarum]|uniref:DedA family protein n=1 Tax=Helicobacter didelphidarum TaxID=2040648 RepID=A0A3D8IEN9_9HELI|nr:DedA family protein [Helicobacter didelphidarum]RDU63465.1 DedA family protein [Helicobacter didelphidarum]
MQNEAFEILKDYSNLESFGYLILFLYCMGGGYVAIISAGVLSSLGKLDLSVSIALAIIGNTLGSSLFAIIARAQKKDIMKMFSKHRRKIAYLQIMVKKYDWGLFLISKFLHGVRTFVPLAVGISAYNIIKFLFINFIGAIIWGISLGMLGYYASGIFLEIIKILLQYPYMFPIVFIGIIIAVTFFLYIKKKLKQNTFIHSIHENQ